MVEEKKPEETMDVEQVDPDNQQEGEGEEEASDASYNLRILPMTHELHQKHGLRHNDYQRYRGYCSRRIARVRKATKMVQGEKKRFTKKEITSETLKEEKHLEIPLMTVERAWSYAMQLKFEMNTEPRKRYHMVNRLRKAQKESEKLEKLVMALTQCDARTKLETQAYHLWISGTLYFELQDWKAAMKALTAARTIYEKLSATLSEEEAALYKQRMAEIIPSLRFCAYNSGDEAARQDLLNLKGEGQDVEELLNQAREEQASTLQEVEWRGRKMAVRAEKVRVFLLREKEFGEELAALEEGDHAAKVEAHESLLMDCKDALQVLRDELAEDPNFRQRQQASEGPVSSTHFLYTYLCYLKATKTVDRNLEMVEKMKEALKQAEHGTPTKSVDGRSKPVKPQDLVRLYEAIIANLAELPQLAGLEEDLSFAHEIEAKIVFFKAWRCCFIAQAFLAAQKWPEAMAIFQRATTYANKAKGDKLLDDSFRKEITDLVSIVESRQFMAHANSILDSEGVSEKINQNADKLSKMPLCDRLDEYYEDPDLLKGKPNLAAFPPSFEPLPCKPLFFDLAREQLAFPNLEHKMVSAAGKDKKDAGQQGPGSSGGWLGGWLGGWGGQAKK